MPAGTETDARGAQDGSHEAFARLYTRVSPAIETWARVRLSGSAGRFADPEDLVQEVWWRALSSFARFQPATMRFRAWIFGIAGNVLLETLRRRGGRLPSGTPRHQLSLDDLAPELRDQLTSITRSASRGESANRLASFVLELPAEEQLLFVHRGLEELPSAEVGMILGISENAVNKRWARLREKLARLSVWEDLEQDAT